MIPSPSQIIASFERGEIGRDEMHALMALHARELIQEMDQDFQNPAAAWIESLLARRAAARLVRCHGNPLLREVLGALAEVPGFSAGRHLWNAAHPDVPIHCFLRMRREPVFRILSLDSGQQGIRLWVECGDAASGRKPSRHCFILTRDSQWKLRAVAADA